MNEGGDDGEITFLNGIKLPLSDPPHSLNHVFKGHTTKRSTAASFAILDCQFYRGVSETRDGVSHMESFLIFRFPFQFVVAFSLAHVV